MAVSIRHRLHGSNSGISP